MRIAVPDKQAADALPEIVRQTPVPLIADIHFDYRWALAAIRAGFHGLRLNPGNIRDVDKVKTVVKEAKERGIPIRIGVNAGSLPPIPALEGRRAAASMVDRMVDAAMWEIKILEDMDYDNIKISMKAFDVPTMVEANRRLASMIPYPLHLGVTEAGTPRAGSVRSAIGIGILLAEGIGDTIRVSLAADPIEEIPVCYDILNTLSLRTPRRHARRLPHLRPHRDRADPAGAEGRGALRQARQADHGRGHGLRRQRPRRSEDGRPRHRRRQGTRRHLPQGRDHPHRGRAGVPAAP